MQNAQRRAAVGMLLRHSGHSRVSGSAAGSVLRRAMSAFTGRTTKKKTAAAMRTNAITALMNEPYRNVLW